MEQLTSIQSLLMNNSNHVQWFVVESIQIDVRKIFGIVIVPHDFNEERFLIGFIANLMNIFTQQQQWNYNS